MLRDSITCNFEVEFRQLAKCLEPYTYEQFKADLSDWLKSGLFVFYFHGNLSKEVCSEISQKTLDVLKLSPLVPFEETADVRITKLEAGKTLWYEEILKDEKNQNSCSMVVYQGQKSEGNESQKGELLVNLIGHYLETPFFDDLRTK